jgi:hypothetical protein
MTVMTGVKPSRNNGFQVVKLSSTIKVDSEKQCLNETLYRR